MPIRKAEVRQRLRKTGRARCVRMYPVLGECEREGCLKAAQNRHHIDGDTWNNVRSNIGFLCDQCHADIHLGRGLGEWPLDPIPPRPKPLSREEQLEFHKDFYAGAEELYPSVEDASFYGGFSFRLDRP